MLLQENCTNVWAARKRILEEIRSLNIHDTTVAKFVYWNALLKTVRINHHEKII